jgi:hypothetical protein
MSTTPDDSTPRRHSLTMWGAAAGLLVLLPAMYVGSFGVWYWLFQRGLISESAAEWVGVMFIPLGWLADQLPLLETAICAYMEWLEP